MQQCPLLSAATAVMRYAPTALATYGERAIGSVIPDQLQSISNDHVSSSTGLSTDLASDMGWPQVALIAAGVMVAGTALKGAWERWSQSSASAVERPREEVVDLLARWRSEIQPPEIAAVRPPVTRVYRLPLGRDGQGRGR